MRHQSERWLRKVPGRGRWMTLGWAPIRWALVGHVLVACDSGGGASTPDGGLADGGGGVPTTTLRLESPAEARACEVMLHDPEGVLRQVDFPEGMRGRRLTRGAYHALAYVQAGSIPPIPLQIQGDGDLEITSSRCFDPAAAEVAGARLTGGASQEVLKDQAPGGWQSQGRDGHTHPRDTATLNARSL